MIGYASLMAETPLSATENEEALHCIRSSAAQLLDLVNDLLDLHKVEAGTIYFSFPLLLSFVNFQCYFALTNTCLQVNFY